MFEGCFCDFLPYVECVGAEWCAGLVASAACAFSCDGVVELVEVGVYFDVASGAVVVFDGGFEGAGEDMQEVECVLQVCSFKCGNVSGSFLRRSFVAVVCLLVWASSRASGARTVRPGVSFAHLCVLLCQH